METPQPGAPARTAGRKRDPRTDAVVIEAVLDLVKGGATLSGLSLVTIAEHAGVSRNSLYRRWKAKDDLYLDVLDALGKPLPRVEGRTARDPQQCRAPRCTGAGKQRTPSPSPPATPWESRCRGSRAGQRART